MVNNDWVYPQKPKLKNIILIPLKDRIKYYRGYVYYASLLQPLSLEQENIILKHYNTKYEFINIKNFYKLFYKNSHIKMCSQFIANILEELNLCSKTQSYKFWSYHKKIINLCNNIIYSNPVQIIPNDLILSNIENRKLIFY